MAEPLYLIPTGQGPLTWHSSQTPLASLTTTSTTLAAGLPNPGQSLYKAAPSSEKSSTLSPFLVYCGATFGLRRFSSTATTSLWLISGPLVPPVTLMHLVRSIFFCGATHNFTVLVSHIVGNVNSVADSLSRLQMTRFWLQQQTQYQPPFLPQCRPSGMSSNLSPIASHRRLHPPHILSWHSQVYCLLHL